MNHEKLKEVINGLCLADELSESELDAIHEAAIQDDGRLARAEEAVRKRDDMIEQILESAAAIANGACPPWDRGDEPDECPDHECVKCWEKWIKGELA